MEGLSTYLCVPAASFAHTRPVVMSRIAMTACTCRESIFRIGL